MNIISRCDSLVTLPLKNFSNIKWLIIRECKNLEYLSVSKSLQNIVQIVHLSINCPCESVESFPKEGCALLPPSFAHIERHGASPPHIPDKIKNCKLCQAGEYGKRKAGCFSCKTLNR